MASVRLSRRIPLCLYPIGLTNRPVSIASKIRFNVLERRKKGWKIKAGSMFRSIHFFEADVLLGIFKNVYLSVGRIVEIARALL